MQSSTTSFQIGKLHNWQVDWMVDEELVGWSCLEDTRKAGQKRTVGASPEAEHNNPERDLIYLWGKAGRVGIIQHGEGNAPGRPGCSFQLKRILRKMGTLAGLVAIGQGAMVLN